MSERTKDKGCSEGSGTCASLPEPVRMNYFHGQLISERDLKTEQAYFRDKLRHANRCVHGYGVLCGLEVAPVPRSEHCADQEDEGSAARRKRLRDLELELSRTAAALESGAIEQDEAEERRKRLEAEREEILRTAEEAENREGGSGDDNDNCAPERPGPVVEVSCGAAIDCDGNDLILRSAATIDLLAALSAADRNHLADARIATLYLSVCYLECGREPTRPVMLDSCATSSACRDARVAEGVRFTVSLEPPAEDRRCGTCCNACNDACLLLAAITVERGQAVEEDDIDHSVRRRFGTHDPTVITGISWRQGATYSAAAANDLLGTRDTGGGIEVRFSRPVLVSTLQPGTVDLLRITGGRGLAGVIASMEGEFVGLPADGMVDRIRFRDTTGESVQPKDRIMILVRAPFILDACCRPVEGLHVGGRVPLIDPIGDDAAEAAKAARREEEQARKREAKAAVKKSGSKAKRDERASHGRDNPDEGPCTRPYWGPGPWTSAQPGNFESWFYVSE